MCIRDRVLTDIPSAIVNPPSIVSTCPDSTECFIAGKAFDSTPIIRTFGFLSFIAVIIPAASPPPPIGT